MLDALIAASVLCGLVFAVILARRRAWLYLAHCVVTVVGGGLLLLGQATGAPGVERAGGVLLVVAHAAFLCVWIRSGYRGDGGPHP
jgi:hypothetical protein